MATLNRLYPDGDGTISSVVNEAAAGTNLWQSVDDRNGGSADTSTYIHGIYNTATASVFLTLTSVNSDFGSIDASITLNFSYNDSGLLDGGDTLNATAQIFAADETTAYSNSVTIRTHAGTDQGTTFTETSSGLTVNATGLAADKTAWDAARLKITWNKGKSGGWDTGIIRFSYFDIDGTYTASATPTLAQNSLMMMGAGV